MPQLMGELLALHRQRDRYDDIRKPLAELAPGRLALEAQTEVRANRRPAHSADTPAGREDGDEVVAVRLTELEDRRHGRSGPHEFCRLRRLGCQALKPIEDMLSVVHDGDTGTLCVTARPVVLQQTTHEEDVASVLER